MRPHDPLHLARFVEAQEDSYQDALAEIRNGEKESHWMWFIFPQVAGLGSSPIAQRYAIAGAEEAKAYLDHAVLGGRLLECCAALMKVDGKPASQIFGYPDHLKFRLSMTLFAQVATDNEVFASAIRKYFSGQCDPQTLGRQLS